MVWSRVRIKNTVIIFDPLKLLFLKSSSLHSAPIQLNMFVGIIMIINHDHYNNSYHKNHDQCHDDDDDGALKVAGRAGVAMMVMMMVMMMMTMMRMVIMMMIMTIVHRSLQGGHGWQPWRNAVGTKRRHATTAAHHRSHHHHD